MKRDIDLARELLLDIENRGIDCSMTVLRTGPNQENEERTRYHLRLLIDAGLLKEVDRTSTGIPCLRLTHDGHELLELARHEGRWRQAKAICQQRIGGLSLSVIRQLLIRLALRPTYGRRYRPYRYAPTTSYYRSRPAYRAEPYRFEEDYLGIGDTEEVIDPRAADTRDWWTDEVAEYREPRYVRTRATANGEYVRNGYGRTGIDLDGDGRVDLELDTNIPDYLI
ncbi:MAG: DUF2513 domain-containing protein [Lacipirellulaceae bacterium]